MANVELTITVMDATRIIARDDLGAEETGRADLQDDLRAKVIRILDDFVKSARIERRSELQLLGELLYRTLFTGEVEGLFQRTLMRVPPGERLRVQLAFDEGARDLASLPWEYLWYPGNDSWFSTAVELVLSRFLRPPRGAPQVTLDPGESPLRVLIVVSEPADLQPVLAQPVIDAIEKLAEGAEVHIKVTQYVTPTADDFRDVLKANDPHVLHFMGHGRFNRDAGDGRAEIAFLESAAENAPVDWVTDEQFAEFFRQAISKPKLVFLHLCESGAVDFNSSFAGLAPQLIRKARVPAVVAMQYPIENMFAIQFSRAFYKHLAKGEPVDSAVQLARYELTNLRQAKGKYTRVFGTPVLYMHARSGAIVQPVGTSSSPGKSGYGFTTREAGRTAGEPTMTESGRQDSVGGVGGGPASAGARTQTAEDSNPATKGLSAAELAAFSNAYRKARSDARQTLGQWNLKDEQRAGVWSSAMTTLDQAIRNPRQSVDILTTQADQSEGALRDVLEVLREPIQQWYEKLQPETKP